MLKIGVLKEIRNSEGRVGLSPDGVRKLTADGIKVYVEGTAGENCNFSDEHYEDAGAEIVPTPERLVEETNLIVKIQPPSPVESELLTDQHIIFSFLNLPHNNDRIKAHLATNSAYFGMEYLEDAGGNLPVMESMSEIAGRMAIHIGAWLMSVPNGGKGILLSGTDTVQPANITILGSGVVGRVAAIQAWTNGANVNLVSVKKDLSEDNKLIRDGLMIQPYSEETMAELLKETDIFIVALYSMDQEHRSIRITKSMIADMAPGSLVMDLSVEQNTVVETSHVTSLSQPAYSVDKVLHYCVPNIAASVPLTASKLYSRKVVPYVKLLAKSGLKTTLDKSPELLSALAAYKGKVTNRKVADLYGYKFYNIFDLLEHNL